MSTLKRLQISHLRNLQSVSVEPASSINLFYGKNGSGKTSLLEAISLLGLGRSFRTHKTKPLIYSDQTQLTVFGEVVSESSKHAVGVQKSLNSPTLIHVDGEAVPGAVALAQQLPLQIINTASFQLIEGSSLQRRQFLDWMVFHVKPEFIAPWKRLQRVIKQRNSLLKRDKITRSELAPWDAELIHLSAIIHGLRQEVFESFVSQFQDLKASFSNAITDVVLNYQPGWNQDYVFEDVLKNAFERDSRDGYTHHSPHRADIKISIDNKPAIELLSRGQEKTLICALHIAQARLYQLERQQACVFLVDDLLAELDDSNALRLATWLRELEGQVFVTGISKENLLKAWQLIEVPKGDLDSTFKVFHVEHGVIKEDTL